MADPQVGEYLNEHCVCAYQKMGTFRVVNGQKQGGNVVSYFVLPDQTVLHAVAGPVDAAALLREARWVVETRKMGIARSHGDMKQYRLFWRQAHAERLEAEHGMSINVKQQARNSGAGGQWSLTRREAKFSSLATGRWPLATGSELAGRSLNLQGQVHLLLANKSLVKLNQISEVVFERILGQKVSTLPVIEN